MYDHNLFSLKVTTATPKIHSLGKVHNNLSHVSSVSEAMSLWSSWIIFPLKYMMRYLFNRHG